MYSPEPVHHVGSVWLRNNLTSEVRDGWEIHSNADLNRQIVRLEILWTFGVTSSRRKARNEMMVSMSVAPGLAVTQQIAMETDIIIKTVFRMAASLQPENIERYLKVFCACLSSWKLKPFWLFQDWFNPRKVKGWITNEWPAHLSDWGWRIVPSRPWCRPWSRRRPCPGGQGSRCPGLGSRGTRRCTCRTPATPGTSPAAAPVSQ